MNDRGAPIAIPDMNWGDVVQPHGAVRRDDWVGQNLPFKDFLNLPDGATSTASLQEAPLLAADPFNAMQAQDGGPNTAQPPNPGKVLVQPAPAGQADAFEQTGPFGLQRATRPALTAEDNEAAPTAGPRANAVIEAMELRGPEGAAAFRDGKVENLTVARPTPKPAVNPGVEPAATSRLTAQPAVQTQALVQTAQSDGAASPPDEAPPVLRTAATSPGFALLASKRAASPILVAIHATEAGLRVVARVERMSAEERDRLSREISELLTEYGLQTHETFVHDRHPAPR